VVRFIRTENRVYQIHDIEVPNAPTPQPEVAHHIFVVDRSGSMYGDIDKLKSSMESVLAAEDITGNGDVETTLISFSSHGDVRLHWNGVRVEDVMKLDNPYLGQLRSIRATALTGISQGLNLALQSVKSGQTTGITLFTDGYANDPSAYVENKALDAFVENVSVNYPNVFVNCIGYRDWCDWPRMNAIASALSGKCIKATSFKAVLEAMRDTQVLLSGNLRSAISVPNTTGGFLCAMMRSTGQINTAPEGQDLVLRGVSTAEEVEVYAITRVNEPHRNARVLGKDDAYIAGGLAAALLGMGNIREAKAVLFASGNKTLWSEHQTAMTPSSIAHLVRDLQDWVGSKNNESYEMGRNVKPQFDLFDLASAINSAPARSFGFPLDAFYSTYKRRSIKKIPGTRNPDGTLTPPRAHLVPRDNDRIYVKSLDFNRADATVNISTSRAMWVQRDSDNKIFHEVNYISLEDLAEYRSYTLFSSGERNVDILPLDVYTKDGWEAIKPFLMPHEAREFTPSKRVNIALRRFRVEADVSEIQYSSINLRKAIEDRFRAVARVKILSAMQDKAAASPFTPEQIQSLAELHLTPALYFSAPTTTHYTDKSEAVASGSIDSYTRYKINFGLPDIRENGDFRSGNAFLDRRYAVTLNGVLVSKPKLDTYLQGAVYTVKPPSPKAKDTPADVLMAEEADAILLSGDRRTNEQITKLLEDARGVVERVDNYLQVLVMEIGCTGMVPEFIEQISDRYEPEAFSTKFGVKLSKNEAEGIYYATREHDVVIAVTPETEWYTVWS
jgi:hypothetical protein